MNRYIFCGKIQIVKNLLFSKEQLTITIVEGLVVLDYMGIAQDRNARNAIDGFELSMINRTLGTNEEWRHRAVFSSLYII